MKIDTNETIVDELLSRSIKDILPGKEPLREALLSGRRLRIYIGTDATGTSLHLGHSTNYLLLEKFRQLGHEIIFLIGDFTSRIGDPTDKSESARKQLTREQVVENTRTWLDQVRPIIDLDNADNPVKIMYNHDWLAKLTFEDVISLSSHFTVQQMIERDMFQKRINDGLPLYLHELFYPLMQGYDSVVMDVDIEVCGSDQTFNALAGRTLLRKIKNKEKFVMVTTLLENPKTKEKMMSKSLGTGVYLDFDHVTMYGAVMAQPDENMRQLFVDCTRLSLVQIASFFEVIENPRDLKMRLAREVTAMYHGAEKAEEAEQKFVDTFQQGGVPEEVSEINFPYVENLVKEGVVSSKSDLRRLLEAGGVRDAVTGEKLTTIPDAQLAESLVLKLGKRRFVRLM